MNYDNGNNNITGDFLRVLMALKSNISKSINVAEVGLVENVDEEWINCTLFCDGTTIYTKKLDALDIKTGDCVLVIFTGHEFATNLNRVKNRQTVIVQGNEENLHTRSTGIIVGKL